MMALAIAAFASIAFVVVACAAPEAQQAQPAPPATEASAAVTPTTPPPPPILDPAVAPPLARENTSTIPMRARGAISLSAAPTIATPLPLDCAGAFAQGGTAICRTVPGADIVLDGQARGRADAGGWFVIGFDRDSPATSRVEVASEGVNAQREFAILPREFAIQRVDGLPPQTVTPTDPAIVARLARDRETKNHGFASRAAAEGWLDGFIWPVEGRISGSWGNQRVLNGEPRSPHYGVDIAMPEGTPIKAPAGGVVALAEPDLYLEGGLVLLDHGQGLISMYLHMSRLDVREGDRVEQGQSLGAVGKAGRATGAHLCWRMKWRDRNLDPSLAILGLAQARVQLAGATP